MLSPVNFSSKLPIENNVYSFNPSIAHWKDNLYLCSYREFVRYRHLFQRSKPNQSTDYNYTINRLTNPNHPWLGGIKEICVRKIIDGFDDTKMCIIKIDIETSEILLDLIDSIMYDQNGVILENIDGVDARLLRIGTDKFLLSYNTSIQQDGATVPCVLISTRIIDVIHSDHIRIHIYPETILCQGVSHCDQKNWSFSFLSNGNIAFSYGLYPQHVMYLVPFAPDKNIVALSCDSTQTLRGNQDNIFSKLVNYYGETNFFVSASTPTVKINSNNPDFFVGVGHIKFDYSKPINFYPKDSELVNFCIKMSTDKNLTHQKYIYLMFFYEININDGNITSCSNMFIPPGGTYCFPCGLTLNNTDIILSYGENDEKCMITSFSIEEVTNLYSDENNIVNKQANEVLFYMMSEEDTQLKAEPTKSMKTHKKSGRLTPGRKKLYKITKKSRD
jgi:hypothetical protein